MTSQTNCAHGNGGDYAFIMSLRSDEEFYLRPGATSGDSVGVSTTSGESVFADDDSYGVIERIALMGQSSAGDEYVTLQRIGTDGTWTSPRQLLKVHFIQEVLSAGTLDRGALELGIKVRKGDDFRVVVTTTTAAGDLKLLVVYRKMR